LAFNPLKSGSDKDLLSRLKSGDQRAWADYTREYSVRVYNFLLAKLPNAEDADDVLSETMLATVKAVQTFDGRASLSTLTFAIAQRKLADFWRRRQQTSELLDTISTNAVATDRLEFMEALNKLPKPSQDVLLLRYQVGLGVQEIADVIGRSYKAVESLLSRAREQLREALEDVISQNE